jgi:leucyl-tRNA synthetase
MVLNELGFIDFEEPYPRFRAHGTIVKDGAKMSKSRGNVVVPDDYINRWGADTFRMYLMSLGPFQEGGDFRDSGINGPSRFLHKVWQLVTDSLATDACGEITHRVLVKWHRTRAKVTEDMEALKYNTAIAAMMELVNALHEENCCERQIVTDLVLMLAPIAPHFAEENWERLGNRESVFDAAWPTWDPALMVDGTVEVVIQVSGKTRSKVSVDRDAAEDEVLAAALKDETTLRFTSGKETRKVVYVPNRLINIVVG